MRSRFMGQGGPLSRLSLWLHVGRVDGWLVTRQKDHNYFNSSMEKAYFQNTPCSSMRSAPARSDKNKR